MIKIQDSGLVYLLRELMMYLPLPCSRSSALGLLLLWICHLDSLLLSIIPFLMPPPWHSYHELYIWSSGTCLGIWHWREVHLCPCCSPICASMGCLKFRWVFSQPKPSKLKDHMPLRGPVEAPSSSLRENCQQPLLRGKERMMGTHTQLVPEKTSSQNSLSPLFALLSSS